MSFSHHFSDEFCSQSYMLESMPSCTINCGSFAIMALDKPQQKALLTHTLSRKATVASTNALEKMALILHKADGRVERKP